MINKMKITMLKRIENGLIIAVTNAKGALKCQRLPIEENKVELTTPMVMTLNDIPIVQMSPNYCPTCCGLLATGYGIDNANCSELLKISDYINSEFNNLESLIEKIKPLIGLLENGIYLIRDIKTFPTDEQYAVDSILKYDKVDDMTEAEIYQYILRQENPGYYAEMILHYLYRHHLSQINPILIKFVNLPVNGETVKIIGTALRYLMNFKNEETEKICLEFVIGNNDYLADIAKDYWADI